ncbi:phosphonate C-P lyase system protein PhnG [Paenibacillus eucommiae]|uniref:Alpha-D-ribose 1-methylphosphonate 5-triphosphate synthase subunit PhnG n=1 Tax=Paenibacillus eucommiae TaxID=1355755 RepID=A0ABS4IX63_9BACL|nr:phosphonate C-P lyase system protein PhnG [Paenibacillus eucommiae]MBP1992164.1 alpha-D-ribose 1-methylphosphonate 5-triphosphate synthase subunit PhnG [Paenibacillus eucommiae]
MKKSRLTHILVEGAPDLLEKLALQVEQKYQVTLVREPERSLVMNKARDSVSGNPFYMGEILITECTVSVESVESVELVGSVYGFGAIMGEEPERAYQLAVVDCAYNAKLPETLEWETLLIAEELQIDDKKRLEHSRLMMSKVNFDTMGDQNVKS